MAEFSEQFTGVNILLVDPHEGLTDILARGLRKTGAAVAVATTPEEGLNHLRQHPCSVCVVSHEPPALGAVEFMEAASVLSEARYVIVSSGDISLATRIPVSGILLPPFQLETLLAIIKRAVSQ